MKNQEYYDEIVSLLQGLSSEHNDERKKLHKILFDMSIDLSYCIGAIQSITSDQSLSINPNRLQVLNEAENRLETLTVALRKSLIDVSKD